ncbi:AIPR family protein [Rubripirellula sp.]|nr:AIPR family protein [Rubripirellula sp.]MDB4634102.1 AIPR family protein [Rubripirellula sp.]
MDKEISHYKLEIFNRISHSSEAEEVFPEESYFEYVSDLLSEAGMLDNVQYSPYRNSRKGIRIDGYSWNELERTICGIVVNFNNDPDVVGTLTNTNIQDLGKRVTRFFEKIGDPSFIDSLEVTDPGWEAASEISEFLGDAIKFRVVVFTDTVVSSRVKKLTIGNILDKETSIEIWDLKRLHDLENSDSEYEEFTVNLNEIEHGTQGIRVLPANASEQGVSTYLGVMPGNLLSAIYDEFGQRLLESNVRTFLDFRGGTNQGMKKSLVVEPEHFFAYNNGLTVTATAIDTEMVDGQLTITSLENMQIVNGGQTTAAIYFSPREKGGIKGAEKTFNYKDIELDKVYVQMKLSVIEDKEKSDEMKANIATFANSQNSIQQSDLVSNHPFHLNIETRSRKQIMPAGENGLSTKWFYERARGQYSTKLRAMKPAMRKRFELECPKKQVFTKTDMAKYENTWRMKPFLVKKGAQANLKALGVEIIKEYEADEEAFGPAFYNDLVAKMILFRRVDSAILQAPWYKEERGLKAEIVTYAIALLRHGLQRKKRDINLTIIFKNQAVSETLLQTILGLAKRIREAIKDIQFTGGVANPSEFCKSEKGWKKIQELQIDFSALASTDILSLEEIKEEKQERKSLNEASKAISGMDYVMSFSAEEWDLIAEFFGASYPSSHRNVGIPQKCAQMHRAGQLLSDKQLKAARNIREQAYKAGFDFVS